ncbi:ADP-ribosylglycohydrolase family protein [Bacillus sp. 1P06AnD]|uniref:ADP-ribosylglycohydrolase family protein n=1 Tax=Bacillus sp. 1P06AnD TaxID=3132208 RepID=UPI0039A338CA
MDKSRQRMEALTSSFLGYCIGDALGLPFEFKQRGQFGPVQKMEGFGTHNQPPGTWSDDTSMTMCTAECLCDGYHADIITQSFLDWFYEGKWTHNKKRPFFISHTTYKVLSKLKYDQTLLDAGEMHPFSNGNASLMRILPVAFFVDSFPLEERLRMVGEVSAITHAHPRSIIACSIYSELVKALWEGSTMTEALATMRGHILDYYEHTDYKAELPYFERILHTDLSSCTQKEIKSSAYVVDTLEACFWCLLTTGSFREALIAAVELGEDTDTIAALTGGLAGILYGGSQIPEDWLSTIPRKDEILEVAAALYHRCEQNKYQLI